MLLFNESFIFILQIVFTALMTGVIWVIQLVHYPSFHYVNMVVYPKFQKFHMKRISFIVMPFMIMEMLTAFLLVSLNQSVVYVLNLLALILIWLSTAFLSVPCHSKLEKAYSYEQVDRLVRTNWPRTILWSLRLTLLAYCFMTIQL